MINHDSFFFFSFIEFVVFVHLDSGFYNTLNVTLVKLMVYRPSQSILQLSVVVGNTMILPVCYTLQISYCG